MIRFENITLSYDKVNNVIDNLNLDINDNEFLVIVGPSGCGKTSLVRMLSGLTKQSSGNIYINDAIIDDLEPYQRGISYMQQDAKPYPFMNVYENIAFGLELKKERKDEIDKKVNEIADMLSIKPYLKRMPKELSGGEVQRLNLAKILVLDNKIVILDEVLSSIDAKLKKDLRFDIKKMHKYKNNTTIYITHDQEEAMSLADRIVLMNEGKIVQIGTPIELYNNPNSIFSAGFIGKMNFIEDNNSIIGFRPENVSINGDILVKIIDSEIIGNKKNIYADLNGVKIEFLVDLEYIVKEEEKIRINKKYIFDSNTKMRKE